MLADLHTHTNTSHGHHSAAEMYEAAATAGLDLFGLSEHSPLPEEYACKLYVAAFPGNFRDFVRDVQALRQRELEREDRPLPLLGVELDWLPDYPRHMCRFLSCWPFSYVIGSLHYVGLFPVARPNTWTDGREAAYARYREYYEEMARMAASGLVNGALATPVGQVCHRSRVGGVVQHAEGFAALFVVGAVQVYTVTEHMGFAVRNTFINGEKRVIYLFFHQKKLLSFHFRRNNIVPPGLSSLYAIFLHLSIAFFIKKQKKRFINLVVLTKLFRWCFYVENREFCRKDTCQASCQHTLDHRSGLIVRRIACQSRLCRRRLQS